MARYIITIFLSLLVSITQAQTLAVEDFNYADQAHITDNGWTNYGDQGTRIIITTTPGLTYSGYVGSGIGNGARLLGATASESGEDDYKGFTTTNSGSIYASFLVNISAVTTIGDCFFHLMRTSTDHYCNVYVKKDGSNNLFFGIAKKESSSIVWTSSSYSLNTTYLLVINYVFNSSTTTDDEVSLWVNPTISGTEPAATVTQSDSELDATDVWGGAIRQGAANAPAGKIDGIRIATSWDHSINGKFANGTGTAGDPYQITNAAQLNNVRDYLSSNFILNNDVALTDYQSGSGWVPIGTSSSQFTGVFDGNGKKITGLMIDASDDAGLFGNVGLGGQIKSLGVETMAYGVNGSSGVGGLVGTSSGTITSCSVSGNVTGSVSEVGGLVGYNFGTISKCYSTAAIAGGTSNTGGLVGYNNGGSIANCYAGGTVNGNIYIGGLIGMHYSGTVSYCYAAGAVTGSNYLGGVLGRSSATLTNNFWDTETSGKSRGVGYGPSDPTGVTGKITTEMKISSTFTTAGWDFTTIWEMVGSNYPRLIAIPDPALPVELTSFTANTIRTAVTLNWQTTTEVNNYGFDVERRRIQNEEWQKIGFVNGAGTSNTPKEYFYSDVKLPPGRYAYRLKQIDLDGSFKYSQSSEVEVGLAPRELSLSNYPNPFNPTTTMEFTLAQDGRTTLKVFNILGEEVATLVNENLRAGVLHKVAFDASKLTSGVYFCVLETNNVRQSRKLLLIK